MQDRMTNELVPGELSEKMRKLLGEDPDRVEEELRREFDATGKVKRADQGPLFVEGEIVPVKGYLYRVKKLRRNRIVLKPHGPIREPTTGITEE